MGKYVLLWLLLSLGPNASMSRRGPDIVHNNELEDRAMLAQLAARSRVAVPKDCFLLTTAPRNTAEDDPVAVLALTSQEEAEAQYQIRKNSSYGSENEPPSEKEARRTFSAQQPHAVTRFKTDRATYSSYLPGGAPLIDHLFVRVNITPDWACLMKPIELLRRHRIPDMKELPNVEEFTLGETEEQRVNEILEYLLARLKDTKRDYIVRLSAADTESVSIAEDGLLKIYHGEVGQTHLLTVAESGESGDPLPVVLMIGHVDWQINIRLPTHQIMGPRGRKQLQIVPGKIQEKALEFFMQVDHLTGVDVNSDLERFFKVVKALYGENLWDFTFPAIELDVLARHAGYNLVRFSLSVLNFVTFGTIMPKGRSSVGDQKWHEKWQRIPTPLQAYMVQDITQAAGIAWVMTICWIIQLFPDAHLITQISTLNPVKMIKWWHKHVVLDVVSASRRIIPWQIQHSRRELTQVLLGDLNNKNVILEMLGDWPSVPAGGARFIHTVRTFLISKLPVLRLLDKDVWPVLEKEQYHMFRFGRFEIEAQPSPTDAVRTLSFSANPGVGPILTGLGNEINRTTIQQVTGQGASAKAVLLEYIRLNPQGGKDLMERVESSHAAGKSVFGFMRKAEEFVPLLRTALEVYGMLPSRPDGWVDLYPTGEKVKKRAQRLTDLALERAKQERNKADLSLQRSQILKTTAKAAKRKLPDRIDHHWPLLNLVTPRATEPGVIPRETALKIGEREESRPPKRRRIENPDHPMTDRLGPSRTEQPVITEPPRRVRAHNARPAETITSGALEREENEVTSRTVSWVTTYNEHTLQLGPPVAGASSPGREVALASQGCEEWRPLLPTGELEFVSTIYIVGSDHARNLARAMPEVHHHQLAVEYIPVEKWTDEAIEDAARCLRSLNLQDAAVFFWLHNDQVFVHASSGAPLFREYDSRLHCLGSLGTITQSRMKRLWEQSWPLITACKQAVEIILITPIPMYLTTPCCELSTHCVGFGQTAHYRGICRDVASLHEATVRWVSRIDSERIVIASPHLEMMEAAAAAREDWAENLRDSYSYDGVHFSYTGNLNLGALIWSVLQTRFWKLRPPSKNMKSPERGPPRAEPPEFRTRSVRQSRWDYGEFDTGDILVTHEREVVFSDAEMRASERGPWAEEEVQHQGPLVTEDEWALFRESVYAPGSGYVASRYHPGLPPA